MKSALPETVHYTSIGPEATFHRLKHGNVTAFLNEHIPNSEEQNKFPSFC